MNRAGAHNDQQAVVATIEHVTNLLTGVKHELAHLIGERLLLEEGARCGNGVELANIDIHCLGKDRLLPQTTFVL